MGLWQNKARQEAIKALIQKHAIEDQDSLVELLKKEYKIETNQSIVSRDLRQLGIGKVVVNDKAIYQIPTEDPTREILRRAVLSIEKNEMLLVIHTMGGLAAFVGDYLDSYKDKGLLGVLAGENVVFVAPKKVKEIEKLYKLICELLYYHPSLKENGDE